MNKGWGANRATSWCIWRMFASDSDYNKQCGLAAKCCIFTIDRLNSLQQSAKGSLFGAKTSISLWWAKRSRNQRQALLRAVDEKWTLHVSDGEEITADFFFLVSFSCTDNIRNIFLNMKGRDSIVLSWIRLFCPHQLGDLSVGRNLLFWKCKIISSFKESSSIHCKYLTQM